MARKHLLNLTLQIGTTGLSQVSTATLIATGVSQEFYEFSVADAAVLYFDTSAVSGTGTPTLQYALMERDPATGLFISAGITITAITATGTQRVVVDPIYGQCYQLQWTITGTTPSFTVTAMAELITRS
jgi:hypothetical protein